MASGEEDGETTGEPWIHVLTRTSVRYSGAVRTEDDRPQWQVPGGDSSWSTNRPLNHQQPTQVRCAPKAPFPSSRGSNGLAAPNYYRDGLFDGPPTT